MSMTAAVTAAPPSGIIAPEFSGRARQFRDRVTAADTLFRTSFDIIADELTRRFNRKAAVPPRPEQCHARINRLKAAGSGFRTESVIDRSRKGFYIYGFRLTPARFGHDDWAGGRTDLGVSVIEYGAKFTIDRSGGKSNLYFPSETFAMFNLHALARFYQRTMGDRSDAALCSALIATASPVYKEYMEAVASKDASAFDADDIRVDVDGGQ